MKEIENHSTIQEVEERQIKKGEKFKGSFKIYPGHIVFELDLSNGLMTKAVMDVAINSITGAKRMKLVQKKNCIYVTALNQKNAIKKFKNIIGEFKGMIKYVKDNGKADVAKDE